MKEKFIKWLKAAGMRAVKTVSQTAIAIMALRKILCKKESKQIRKQITNMVFRSENGRIHLPLLTARSMLYDGMRTAGVNSGRRHRAY